MLQMKHAAHSHILFKRPGNLDTNGFASCLRKTCWIGVNVSGVAKGGGGVVHSWRHFYGGGTMGYAVGCTITKTVLKERWF